MSLKILLCKYIFLAQPLHWIYDDEAILRAVASNPNNPEYFEPSHNPYYNIPCGSQSPYGDQLIVTLRSLAACKGIPINTDIMLFYLTFSLMYSLSVML